MPGAARRSTYSGSSLIAPLLRLCHGFHGYATGLFSSRKLKASPYDSIAFRFIGANEHPDDDTIAAFRRRFLPLLDRYFIEILVPAGAMGLLKLGTVSLDGNKMKANAPKHRALSYGHACKLEQQLEQEAKRAPPDGRGGRPEGGGSC